MELHKNDFVVLMKNNEPLRYSSGEIGLWHRDNLDEVTLQEGDELLSSDELIEPFKSELLNQINISLKK